MNKWFQMVVIVWVLFYIGWALSSHDMLSLEWISLTLVATGLWTGIGTLLMRPAVKFVAFVVRQFVISARYAKNSRHAVAAVYARIGKVDKAIQHQKPPLKNALPLAAVKPTGSTHSTSTSTPVSRTEGDDWMRLRGLERGSSLVWLYYMTLIFGVGVALGWFALLEWHNRRQWARYRRRAALHGWKIAECRGSSAPKPGREVAQGGMVKRPGRHDQNEDR